jgi:predicted RNA-binding protein with PUA-like domain
MPKYWLVKTEPESFSFEDLKKSKNQTTFWDGVRNYQARNYIKEMKLKDKVLFYHSNANPKVVMGVCEVVKEAYADHTQFDPEDNHYFPSADPENPTWFMVDIKLLKEFKNPVTLETMKKNFKLSSMKLLQHGNRLSVMPVSAQEFNEIVKLGS